MKATDPSSVLETVWRIESGRIIAGLARLVRDVGLAEELAQDALVCALEQWPRDGVPDNPGAWLMLTARHRAIDLIRRRTTYQRKLAELGRTLTDEPPPEPDFDNPVEDDLLRLIFTACHPVLAPEARVALTLRLLGGLSTDEIARAFLVSEPTVAQRIVRAKRTLATKNVPFEIPEDLPARLPPVLSVIYLVFNEGFAATSGDDWIRPGLCSEAMRLGRVLAGLMPSEPEVHGLVALMELQASRFPARVAADGSPVLLMDQDRRRWDRLLIRRGLAALSRARDLGSPGLYTLQAEIAACHARALDPSATDWHRIADLYGTITAAAPSPVAELNRAVAVGMAQGPAAGLAIVEALAEAGSLDGYAHLPAVRGDLLAKLGRHPESRAEFARAAALTRNERERALFQSRAS